MNKPHLHTVGVMTAILEAGDRASGIMNRYRNANAPDGATNRELVGDIAVAEDYAGRAVQLLISADCALESDGYLVDELSTGVHGVVWILIRRGRVVLERCPKKARTLGVGEWFLPGGKLKDGESPEAALDREIKEEWPGVHLTTARPLPIVEGSPVPPGPNGTFLMRPFVVAVDGAVPEHCSEGTPLVWFPIAEALSSPVPQVRMMVAAAMGVPNA